MEIKLFIYKKNPASTLKSLKSKMLEFQMTEKTKKRNLYIRELLVIIILAYICLNRTTLHIIPMLLVSKIVPQPIMEIHDFGFREGLANAFICDQNGENRETN